MPKPYRITRFTDLLEVPPDRRQACIEELLEGLTIAEPHIQAAKRALPRWLRWMLRTAGTFVWIDARKSFGLEYEITADQFHHIAQLILKGFK